MGEIDVMESRYIEWLGQDVREFRIGAGREVHGFGFLLLERTVCLGCASVHNYTKVGKVRM
jgi:hypothetical protein